MIERLDQVLAQVDAAEIGEAPEPPERDGPGVSRSDACRSLALPAVCLDELRPLALVVALPAAPQVSSDAQHLLLTGFPILRKQFHLSREPVLVFPKHIGGRLGIANMLGRFKRRVHALLTPGKPTVRKFLQVFERGFLVLPELDAHRRIDLQGSHWLQDVRK